MDVVSSSLLAGLHRGLLDATHPTTAFVPQLVRNDKELGKTVLAVVDQQLRTCQGFWFSVAFATKGGVATLLQALHELAERGVTGRVLVSQYQNFTQPEALRALRQFPNIELRIATTGNFHAKGYWFSKKDGEFLLLGSSNLTAGALRVNTEWNLLVGGRKEGELLGDVRATFLREFGKAREVDEAFIAAYEQVYAAQAKARDKVLKAEEKTARLVPNRMQQEALQGLHELRLAGKKKSLLVSATGTGKTYLAAFDAWQVGVKKLLFVVHRRTIAKAAMRTFARVFGTSRTLGLYSGGERGIDADFVFCTVQTLARENHLQQFPSAHFDYIVVDETHRSGALTYQRLLTHFTPDFLLGMTATPERTDGFDIFAQFDHNIAYEIRLQRALEEEMLCPFHYFGVTDVSVGGEVLAEQAGILLLSAPERVRHILATIRLYGCDTGAVRGLVFCRSVEECVALSQAFNQEEGSLRTRALSGASSEQEREEAISLLESDDEDHRLHYLFTVDIFNEGVDIPRVNQVLLLRPTTSPIVFVQQLGRGLRKAEGKEYLTVIDFIGNYTSNYLIPVALFGDTSYNKDTLRKLLAAGSSLLPGTSTIHFDRIAQAKIYAAIDAAKLDGKRELVKEYTLLRYKLGRLPMMVDFVAHGGRDPYQYVGQWGSYYAFVRGQEQGIELDVEGEELLRFFSLYIANAKRIEEVEIVLLLLERGRVGFEELQAHLLTVYGLALTSATYRSCIRNLNFVFMRMPREVVQENGEGQLVFAHAFTRLLSSSVFHTFLLDLLHFAQGRYRTYRSAFIQGFFLYEKYSRRDVCRILNWEVDESATVYGYKTKYGTCPLFVNYEKEGDISERTRYADGFVDPSTFDWMSKSNRKLTSRELAPILTGEVRLPLFVKKSNDEGADFYYVGEMRPLAASEGVLGGVPVVQVRFGVTPAVAEAVYGYLVGGGE